MTEQLDVHVSLVNTNNRVLALSCLRSLPAACEGLSWAVTVVDNASTDGSAAAIADEFPAANILVNTSRLGFSRNHNQVIEPVLAAGSARYVMILNEDTELDGGCVSALVARADRRPRVGAAGPSIYGTDGRPQPSFFGFPTIADELRLIVRPAATPHGPRGGGWLNGSCVLLRVAALHEVGPLDDSFFIFYEDADICRRLADAGWSAEVVPTARMLHHGHQTVSRPAPGNPMDRQMLRSRYLYFRKHHSRSRAAVVQALSRAGLAARASKAGIEALVRPQAAADERELARVLWALACYDPDQPLPHERAGDVLSAPQSGPG